MAILEEHKEELALLEIANVGKPISSSRGEIGYGARVYDYCARMMSAVGGQTIPISANGTGLTFREPVGVCGLIVPWNLPFVILAWKLARAWAMGNTVVIKPADWTPLTALRLAELSAEAGIPPGVINVVTGLGSVAGAALAEHPAVRKIPFTGSTNTGSSVIRVTFRKAQRVKMKLYNKSRIPLLAAAVAVVALCL